MSVEKAGGVQPVRTTEPASLLSQWWTLGAIAADRRCSGRHIKSAWVIIDRHMTKHGNAKASVRFIKKAVGLSNRIVVKACRELVEWGYFTQRVGSGTRATEFTPNWSSVSPMVNARGGITSVAQECNTSVPQECNASENSVTPMGDESYLRNRPTGRITVSRIEDTPAAPTAPPLAGLAPASAGTAVDPKKAATPFDELWQAYPLKVDKSKAKAAYAKLAPDAELHAKMVQAAIDLAEHHKSAGTEKTWIKRLQNWITEERYDEDLPVLYVDAKAAAIAKKKEAGPSKQAAQEEPYGEPILTEGGALLQREGLFPKTPQGKHYVEIINTDIASIRLPDQEHLLPDTYLIFEFKIYKGEHEGKEFVHTFFYSGEDEDRRMEGQEIFRHLRKATKKESPKDTKELIGSRIVATVKRGGKIQYVAA